MQDTSVPLEITFLDEDLLPPVFDQLYYEAIIPDASVEMPELQTVKAVDGDGNNNIGYSLDESNPCKLKKLMI